MESSHIQTPDGITWYTERYTPANPTTTSTDPIILIPSGEGDCGNLSALATKLSQPPYNLSVLTFDNPGFSRSSAAPKEAYAYITPTLFATQILTLLDTLGIERANFFGNSSGACAVLAVAALAPQRVRCGIVHEAPLENFPPLAEMGAKSDADIAEACAAFFANGFIEQEENEGRRKWDALGPEYHARLRKNYVTWVRSLVNHFERETCELVVQHAENVRKVPLFWTVGGLSDAGHWAKDWEVAALVGTTVRTDVLRCRHFPYVSVVEDLAAWVGECVGEAGEGV